MRAFKLALSLALIFPSAPVRAGITDFTAGALGTAGSEFLNIDVDPRGIAMGGAFSSVTSNAFAMYWNPAGLSRLAQTELVVMVGNPLAGKSTALSWLISRQPLGVLGVCIIFAFSSNAVSASISSIELFLEMYGPCINQRFLTFLKAKIITTLRLE